MSETQTVFISYNQADRAWAEWIAWILEEEGFETKIQAWDFHGNFVLEMDQAAKEAEQTIIVLSQNFLDAQFTQPEWAAAFANDPTSKKNKLVPVRVAEVVLTGLLAQINYVDFLGKDEGHAKDQLIARVQGVRGKPSVKPDFPGRPKLQTKPAFPSASLTSRCVWNIPYARNPKFTGRQAIIADLAARLQSGQYAALVQTIAGLGGIGKTQIAIEYAYRYEKQYDVVWWIRAGEPATLDIDFAALADALGLPVKNLPEQQAIVEAVRRWLDQNKGWLLIFDNAEDQKAIEAYLPRNSQGHVIITSRNPSWSSLAQSLVVKEMTIAEATDFLVGDEASADKARAVDLAEELGCLPLALAHAKAYIDETGTSIDDYLALFKEHHRVLLKEARAINYPLSVAATWKMSFTAAQAHAASSGDFVAVCSFMASDAILPDFFFGSGTQLPEALSAICADKLAFNNLIAALRRYSLIEVGDRKLSFHRLVQAVIRDGLSEPEKKHWATITANLVNALVPEETWDAHNWPALERMLPHAIAVTEHLNQYQILPGVAGRLRNQVGDYLRSRAKFSSAHAHLNVGLRLREQAFGANHPEVASSLYSLGWLYKDLAQYKKAEEFTRCSLEIREKILGPDHRDTANSLGNLSSLYKEQGQYAKAEPLFLRSLEICEKALGADHRDTATSLCNLATFYEVQGQYAKAEPLLRRSLKIREKILGPDHPHTANGLNNLAALYRAQKQNAKAEPLFRRSLVILEKVVGPDHPATAGILNNLAGLYQDKKQYTKAEPLLLRSLEIREKVLGPDHPDTALCLNNLAGLYQDKKQYTKAEPLLLRSLEIREKVLGPNHPDTAYCLNNLACLYEKMRRKEEAKPLYQRALDIRQSLLKMNPDDLVNARGFEQSRLGVARTSAKSPFRNDEKPGRNDPCPCGSGKKFKKCCMISPPDRKQ